MHYSVLPVCVLGLGREWPQRSESIKDIPEMSRIPLSDFHFNTSVLIFIQIYRYLHHLKALSSKNKTK